jgi:hypothetical protein
MRPRRGEIDCYLEFDREQDFEVRAQEVRIWRGPTHIELRVEAGCQSVGLRLDEGQLREVARACLKQLRKLRRLKREAVSA